MTARLLPPNSTPWERVMADVMSPSQNAIDAITLLRTAKLKRQPPSILPALVYEYGLDILRPYVPNINELIDEGLEWQGLCGSVPAFELALSWLQHTGLVKEANPNRNFWNGFQLHLDQLPQNDMPNLERIEGVANLSKPLRSNFSRCVHEYNVGAFICDETRLDRSMLGAESGILVPSSEVYWSFGRTHEFAHTYMEAEGVALDNWIDPVGDGVTWNDLDIAWQDANFAWNADPLVARAQVLAKWFEHQRIYVAFKDADNAIIGYRMAHAMAAEPSLNGFYSFGGLTYAPSAEGTVLQIEARTGFNDASAIQAETISIVLNPTLVDGVPPGRLWLQANDLSGGVEMAPQTKQVPLRGTVREHIKIQVVF